MHHLPHCGEGPLPPTARRPGLAPRQLFLLGEGRRSPLAIAAILFSLIALLFSLLLPPSYLAPSHLVSADGSRGGSGSGSRFDYGGGFQRAVEYVSGAPPLPVPPSPRRRFSQHKGGKKKSKGGAGV